MSPWIYIGYVPQLGPSCAECHWGEETEEAGPAVQCAPVTDNTSYPLHGEPSSARSEGADL